MYIHNTPRCYSPQYTTPHCYSPTLTNAYDTHQRIRHTTRSHSALTTALLTTTHYQTTRHTDYTPLHYQTTDYTTRHNTIHYQQLPAHRHHYTILHYQTRHDIYLHSSIRFATGCRGRSEDAVRELTVATAAVGAATLGGIHGKEGRPRRLAVGVTSSRLAAIFHGTTGVKSGLEKRSEKHRCNQQIIKPARCRHESVSSIYIVRAQLADASAASYVKHARHTLVMALVHVDRKHSRTVRRSQTCSQTPVS